MDVGDSVLSGTLIVSPQSSQSSFNLISKKKALQKHCILFGASRHGIERLEILDKEDDKNPRIITLENCVKITQEPVNQIKIVKKTNDPSKPNDTLTLFALNESDLQQWIEALQNVAFKEKTNTLIRTNSVREEENDLYCTSYSDGIFTVNLQAIDAAKLKYSIEKALHIDGNKPIPTSFTMQLTSTEIQLKHLDINGVILITQWPYRYIRKYGYRDDKFTFEAGRACETGEGEFKFQHTNPKEVFRCMGAKMKSMKRLINGDNSIGSLDCGEHQLNAALSMEAGSRSPLPPSPNQNYADNSQSQNSHLLHGFLSSTDSLNNISMSTSTISSSVLPAIMKITPCKPPRKSIESNGKPRTDVPPKPLPKSTKYPDYEPVSLAQTGTSDLIKPTSLALKSSPPPPLPTSPIPSNGSLTPKPNILPLINSDHSNIKSPVHSPVVDQPPRIPARYESMIQDDRNYERIETITHAWKTMGVTDIKHTENLSSTTDDDFTDFVWQRSQSQKEFGSSRKIPITVNAYHDAEELSLKKKTDYDTLNFWPAKKINPASDYRTIVTITSPEYKKQTSQPVTSNDYEIIGDCAMIVNNMNSNIEPKSYRLADDSHMGYGILRKPTTNTSPSSKSPQQTATDASASSTSVDDLVNHRKFNGLNYAVVNKSNQV